MEFGKIDLSYKEICLYDSFNEEIILLGKRMPEPLCNLAGIFFMEYSKWKPGMSFGFFANYYPPSYTVLYWINHHNPEMNDAAYFMSIRVQAMAMFLHSLDDHLCDGQLSTDILKLQLRTVAWDTYIEVAKEMCRSMGTGKYGNELIQNLTNDYFTGMIEKDPDSLEGYLSRFRKQWATWILSPGVLVAGLYGEETFPKLKEMYESFGLAWRLMDDIQDWKDDFLASQISAVYYFLPEEFQKKWKEYNKFKDKTEIAQYIEAESIGFQILKRISDELKNSIRLANDLGFEGLAKEFEAMTHFYI